MKRWILNFIEALKELVGPISDEERWAREIEEDARQQGKLGWWD